MACSCFIAFDDTLSAFATYDVLKSYGPARCGISSPQLWSAR